MSLDTMLVLEVEMSEIIIILNRMWVIISVLNMYFREVWRRKRRKAALRTGVGEGIVRKAGCGG